MNATLFFRDGRAELITGDNIHDVCNKAKQPELDFFLLGNRISEYRFVLNGKKWELNF